MVSIFSFHPLSAVLQKHVLCCPVHPNKRQMRVSIMKTEPAAIPTSPSKMIPQEE